MSDWEISRRYPRTNSVYEAQQEAVAELSTDHNRYLRLVSLGKPRFACVARKVPGAQITSFGISAAAILQPTSSCRCGVRSRGSNRGSRQCSRSHRRIGVSDVAGSKMKAFRHALQLVQISEAQKVETATSRVFRTPTSLWEYQTSFIKIITRIRQHAFSSVLPSYTASQHTGKDPVSPVRGVSCLALFQKCLTNLYQPLLSPHFA